MADFEVSKRAQELGRVLWREHASPSGTVDLGKGFPDFPPPDFLVKALQEATLDSALHQYTRGFGHPRLVNALSNIYTTLTGRNVDPQNELLVTTGAIEALYVTFQLLLDPGDEVIIMEPFFPIYQLMAMSARGVPVFIPLRPNKKQGLISSADWVLDPVELASKFNPKTKMILVNTPHNPLGKVFSREELEMVAHLCREHNVICVMDEVYEWITYEGVEHVRMNTLPGMWERTITIGSAGKAFNITGWRVGWAYGPHHLLKGLQSVHQCCVYASNTIMQEAVAVGLEKEMERTTDPSGYWKGLSSLLQKKRDFICGLLGSLGVTTTVPQGSYYVVCDFSSLASKLKLEDSELKHSPFPLWLCQKKKLKSFPGSNFYGESHKPLAQYLVRFCFAKEDSTLQKAAEILMELKTALETATESASANAKPEI